MKIAASLVFPGQQVICDFCSSPDPITVYQADSFSLFKNTPVIIESQGGWSACAICSALIDAEKWTELLDRSATHLATSYGIPVDFAKTHVQIMHEQFRQHMKRSA